MHRREKANVDWDREGGGGKREIGRKRWERADILADVED